MRTSFIWTAIWYRIAKHCLYFRRRTCAFVLSGRRPRAKNALSTEASVVSRAKPKAFILTKAQTALHAYSFYMRLHQVTQLNFKSKCLNSISRESRCYHISVWHVGYAQCDFYFRLRTRAVCALTEHLRQVGGAPRMPVMCVPNATPVMSLKKERVNTEERAYVNCLWFKTVYSMHIVYISGSPGDAQVR